MCTRMNDGFIFTHGKKEKNQNLSYSFIVSHYGQHWDLVGC